MCSTRMQEARHSRSPPFDLLLAGLGISTRTTAPRSQLHQIVLPHTITVALPTFTLRSTNQLSHVFAFTMTEGALGSDHVNYLVFRYLQESGLDNAAKALYQDWHRPNEYRDPESLPFAPVVKQHELVNIIQDGLFHDQLQASVTNQTRRFQLIESSQSRPPSSQHNAAEARAQAAARRMSSFAQVTDRDDFPTPAAKRPRRSNGSEVYINGDAMEVDKKTQDDADSASGDADRAQSEPDPIVDEEISVELASSSTQTEKKAKTTTSTMYWTLDKREPATVLHTAWTPQSATTPRLLTVGESLCRLYKVPESFRDGDHVSISKCFNFCRFNALLLSKI